MEPEVPTDLTATAESDTQIDLVWTAPASNGGSVITGYKVEVSTDGVSTFTELHTTADGATLTYEHMGLTAGTTYHYQVAAINRVGRGAYASASATTPAVVPDAPASLTATAAGDTQIDLVWTASASNGGAAITGYQLQVSEDGSDFEDLQMTDANTLTYEHTDLTAGTKRYYQVAAINRVGRGAYCARSLLQRLLEA